jgi:hypothetical protein
MKSLVVFTPAKAPVLMKSLYRGSQLLGGKELKCVPVHK